MATLVEIRILPPLAIARLGSSPDPMDNFDLAIDDPLGARHIRPAETLVVEVATGEIQRKSPPFVVQFRDAQGRIRPVAPFFEVWARLEGAATLVPLTTDLLAQAGLTADAIGWSVVVANTKAFRRTADPKDRVEARTGWFSDHAVHPLAGRCPNFVDGASIPFGHVQLVKPSREFPEVRLRFTPAAGLVYGSVGDPDAGRLAGIVYDPSKGGWKGFYEPDSLEDLKRDPIGSWRATNPSMLFTSQTVDGRSVSLGQFDDECDGLVDVALETPTGILTAYARVTAGPPPFAPDSLPVRTAADELEQALLGPDFEGAVTDRDFAEVRAIVRRALETVRLMNTAVLNSVASGLAGNDVRTYQRAAEPIVDPVLADALAIRNRHERVLLALEGNALAWFARVLRHYDQVGDLSALGRRRMPALMRGADGNYLALTRRQVSKVQAAAQRARCASPEGSSDAGSD
jgi:hypothetical protein